MSEKLYARLLCLYPAEFRKQYGEAMLQLFRDRLRADPSWSGVARVWLEVAYDLAVSVPKQHFARPSRARDTSEGFWLSEEAARKMLTRTHLQPAGSVLLAVALGIGIGILGDAPLLLLLALFSPLIIATMFAFSQRGQMLKQWLGYRIRLDGERIVLLRSGRDPLTVERSEIARLIETPGLGLAIGTGNPRKSIWAPSLLTGYDDLRSTLAAWAPIEMRNAPESALVWIHRHAGGLALFWTWALAMSVRSPYFFAPLAVATTVALALLLRAAFEQPAIPAMAKAIPALLLLALLAKAAWLVLAR